jgi:hypothetical protein
VQLPLGLHRLYFLVDFFDGETFIGTISLLYELNLMIKLIFMIPALVCYGIVPCVAIHSSVAPVATKKIASLFGISFSFSKSIKRTNLTTNHKKSFLANS